MYTFTQLIKEIDILLIKEIDKNKISYLTNLKLEVNNQELYYKSIPDNIKTSNTLVYIIQKLTFKLDQFLFSEKKFDISDINPNYTPDEISDDTDVINMAYIKINTLKTTLSLEMSDKKILIDLIDILLQKLKTHEDLKLIDTIESLQNENKMLRDAIDEIKDTIKK